MKQFIASSLFVLFANIFCCNTETPPPAPQPVVTTAGAAETSDAPDIPEIPTGPGTLELNGPPQPLVVPMVPSYNLYLPTAGEYQIDARGLPMDAQLYIYQGNQRVANDSDSGEGTDARIIRFFAPGNYSVRIFEYRARPMIGELQAQTLSPLTPLGTITAGQTHVVNCPQGHHHRAAAQELILNITTPGIYQIDATATEHDAHLMLFQNKVLLEENSDGGEDQNARIRRQLAAGTYTIRVYDWMRRATPISVIVSHDPSVPVAPPTVPEPLSVVPPTPGPNQLTLDAPPIPVLVPAAPSLNLIVTTAGEYQIDAMGSPADAQLYVYQDAERVEQDSDSGEGTDARIIRFLEPGSYSLRVMEQRAQPMNAMLQAQLLTPLTPVGTIVPGQTLPVQVPAGPHPRTASREVTLTIPTQGTYVIDATTDVEHDAQLMLIQNNSLLEYNSDDGEGRNARITRSLAPGSYTLRTYDWHRRATTINLAVRPQ